MSISLQSRINFFVNQLRNGASPQFGNIQTRLRLGQGLPVNIQSTITGQYRSILRASGIAFTERTSGRMRSADAINLPFKSDLGYKYMINVEFKIRDPITGSITTKRTNVGFHRLETKNKMLEAIKERIEFMAENSERYFSTTNAVYIDNSLIVDNFVKFTG